MKTWWLRLYHRVDPLLTAWMARHGITLLRISLGVVFFWFGVLKFFPGLSPAEGLATRTITTLSLGLLSADAARILLATLETLIGLGLMVGLYLRATLFLLFFQMLGTITPIFLFPAEVFYRIPYAPTLEGQYIFKNMVLISAGLVIGATVRGGRLVAEPLPSERREG
ncbi:MAG: DoxX family protein [Thermanaerothrix sp.]|uniref:DoxX family protein n=1 Tax=Thermanaerothrix solaris TaxID=3058434 RepID=A0ABU3NRE1_9CHLR|nr:DoxX family protein [Thermanaerothrix sp. 4228-RoL]MDT8898773.1 DoxX family protein [Thermanaerothrix sp. 4228-RoL]